VAPLDRALALAQVDQAPVRVAQDLDLHVPAAREPALDEDAVVAEGAPGLAARRRHRGLELRVRFHDPHALAAAARGGLHQQRVADVGGVGRILGARQRGHAHLQRQRLGGELVAHPLDGLGPRAHPGQACGDHVGGEARVLGQEAVAGMHGAGAGGERRVEDRLAVEVGLRQPHGLVRLRHEGRLRVGVDVDRHAAQPQRARAAHHAPRDLPAVGHQQRVEAHSRNTP
jgi:hypothetical protein